MSDHRIVIFSCICCVTSVTLCGLCAVCCAGCVAVRYVVCEAVSKCANRDCFSAELFVTYCTVNYVIVRSVVYTVCRYFIFNLDFATIVIAGCGNCFCVCITTVRTCVGHYTCFCTRRNLGNLILVVVIGCGNYFSALSVITVFASYNGGLTVFCTGCTNCFFLFNGHCMAGCRNGFLCYECGFTVVTVRTFCETVFGTGYILRCKHFNVNVEASYSVRAGCALCENALIPVFILCNSIPLLYSTCEGNCSKAGASHEGFFTDSGNACRDIVNACKCSTIQECIAADSYDLASVCESNGCKSIIISECITLNKVYACGDIELCDAVASGKCLSIDSLKTFGKCEVLKSCTVKERLTFDRLNCASLFKLNVCKYGASAERFASDACYTCTEYDLGYCRLNVILAGRRACVCEA